MTATPIPRTLGLTLFGDLDISILNDMPPGRPPVTTRLVPPDERTAAYNFIREQVLAGRQVFVSCPLIQESDKLGVRSATQEAEKLQGEVFPDLAPRIALLHGRMKSAEKEDVMARFQRGEVAILVSTSVVEVGIDIPNATVMMIEGADRFGLAQLHQFRGRIGRGPHGSICLLLTDVDDPETMRRLTAVVTHRSGFDLAEIDLQNRGMGDLHGVQQHGNEFKMANLLDVALISDAQGEAVRLLDRDPSKRARLPYSSDVGHTRDRRSESRSGAQDANRSSNASHHLTRPRSVVQHHRRQHTRCAGAGPVRRGRHPRD